MDDERLFSYLTSHITHQNIEVHKSIVFLSLGSNLGDKMRNCEQALEEIVAGGTCSLVQKSSWYTTQPWGKEDQDWFVNGAAQVQTALSPEELLNLCKDIEQRLGRKDSGRWGPRVIDIDILLYDDLVMNTADLVIPHALLHERNFVLVPLQEIAPQRIHPVLNKSVRDLCAAVQDRKEVQKIST